MFGILKNHGKAERNARPARSPHTYHGHPLTHWKFFRRAVGGRWERWQCTRTDVPERREAFWVRTGDGIHTPHLRPGPGFEVLQMEQWTQGPWHAKM